MSFVILILMFAYRILYYLGPGGVVGLGNENIVFHVVTILLPVNMALFYLVKERGIINKQGLFQFFFVLVQSLTVYFILRDKHYLLFSL